MKLKKWTTKKSKAQAMVEFAIALPVLMLLLYGLLEAGRLLFIYSTVVTASRQAVRYGSTTGEGTNGAARYEDCIGMKNAAQRVAYLGPFDTVNISYDTGPGQSAFDTCTGDTDNITIAGNSMRVVVSVSEQFQPIVPGIVPFLSRTITATSARTILNTVPIIVEQPPEIVIVYATSIQIDAHNPNPSELNQSVNVTFTVDNIDDPSIPPIGDVTVSGGDLDCTYTLVASDNGIGFCTITFSSSGIKPITATFAGNEQFVRSVDSENHLVQLAPTVTTIVSVAPSPSTKNQDVVVTVSVTGGTTSPTGTVSVDAGGNRKCTITLSSNGLGSCTLNFNQTNTYTIRADYNGDGTHDVSNDTAQHQVLDGTATPSLTPTITPIPTITLTPTITPIPPTGTVTPTPVPVCTGVTHGPLVRSGNTLSMTITNPYAYPLTTGTGTVTWNHDKGHQTGSDKSLKLMNASLNGTTIWNSGPTNDTTFSVAFTTPAVIPAAVNGTPTTVTIVFTFHQSYDNLDTSELITFQIATNGCNNHLISSGF